MQRAHHFLFAPEPKLLEDSLALEICGLPDADAVKAANNALISSFTQLGGEDVAASFVEQIEHSICIRSRITEHRLQERLGTDLEQLVILGAGLDTLAYRRADLLDGLQVFEVDHPDTQKLKHETLKNAGIEIPSNLSFAAFDFENQTLAEALQQNGIDRTLPTMFTWLGVHMYLDDSAVRATLAALGGFAKGSELVMDFMPEESAVLADAVEDSISELRKVVEQMGEPIKSRYRPEVLEARLLEAGFPKAEFYTAARIAEEVLNGARGSFCMPDEAMSTLVAHI